MLYFFYFFLFFGVHYFLLCHIRKSLQSSYAFKLCLKLWYLFLIQYVVFTACCDYANMLFLCIVL